MKVITGYDAAGRKISLEAAVARRMMRNRLAKHVFAEVVQSLQERLRRKHIVVFVKDLALELGVRPLVIRKVMGQLESLSVVITIDPTRNELLERKYQILKSPEVEENAEA